MKTIKKIVQVSLLIILFIACSSDDDPNTPTGISVKDVYVAGYEYNGTKGVATYWKNGIATLLTDGPSFARAITVVENDIYVAGPKHNGEKWLGTYWKNGVNIPLTDGTQYQNTSTYAITVVSNNVYGYVYNGTEEDIATYWKNGTATFLTDGTHAATAEDITVIGDDVYVVGYEESDNGNNVATYWKNGVATNLVASADSEAYSLFITTE